MTALDEVGPDSPFWRRLYAYTEERFPLLGHGLLILSYYSSNSLLAQALTAPDQPLHLNTGSLLGVAVLFCFFFHLRVFDEHKDYKSDAVRYPHRVLQRGLVTLRQLTLVAAAAITLELLLAASWRPGGKLGALAAVTLALLYSLLMLREFFCGEWLNKRFVLYAVSHMLIMPLLAMIPHGFATGRYPWEAPAWFWWYAFVGFFVTFNWEISRKVRAPEDEKEGVDTYSSLFGPIRAATLVVVIRLIDTAMVATIGWRLGLSPYFFAAITGLLIATLISYARFCRRPSTKTAKTLERVAGLYIIAFDAALAIELIRKFGVTLEW